MNVREASDACERVVEVVEGAIVADRTFVETILLGVLARGHVL